MALLTALAFAAVHAALLFARPTRGGVALLTGRDTAGALVRRLLAATLIAPVVLGWVWLQARNAEIVTKEGGIALLTIITICVFLIIVLQSGRVLRRTDRARESLITRERDLRTVAEQARAEAENAHAEADRARADAEAASRVKSEFLANMSHELRTPLNAIMGYADLMQQGIGGELSADHTRQMERIQLSARHLLSLINQILSLARLEAGENVTILRAVDLQTLVGEAADIAEPLLLNHNLDFRVESAVMLSLRPDPDSVRQILLNLLSNAAKFTERRVVEMSVTERSARGTVAIAVRDTGVGIAPAHHEHIFEPFWQVDMNATRRHGGAGLGLSVSRELARLLGGDLTVESVPGQGSTFTLELPVR